MSGCICNSSFDGGSKNDLRVYRCAWSNVYAIRSFSVRQNELPPPVAIKSDVLDYDANALAQTIGALEGEFE